MTLLFTIRHLLKCLTTQLIFPLFLQVTMKDFDTKTKKALFQNIHRGNNEILKENHKPGSGKTKCITAFELLLK